MRHRSLTIGALAGAVVLLAGCAGQAGGEPSGNGENTPRTITFGHVLAEEHPLHVCGIVPFAAELEAADVGITVDVFPAGQTHKDSLEQLDALTTGSLDMTWGTPAQLGTRVEEYGVLDLAYLFEDVEGLNEALASPLLDEINEKLLESSGLRVLGAGYSGTRQLTANAEIGSPDDLEDLKLRVLDAPVWIDNGRALGGVPTPVPFSELYLALQTGVVDAQENPLPQIENGSLYEVQEYLMLTSHVLATNMTVISEQTWSELSEEQQEALTAATETLVSESEACMLEQEAELIAAWSEPGSPITVVEDVDLDAFHEHAEAILSESYGDRWDGLYGRFLELRG